jgi:hypothetical protein
VGVQVARRRQCPQGSGSWANAKIRLAQLDLPSLRRTGIQRTVPGPATAGHPVSRSPKGEQHVSPASIAGTGLRHPRHQHAVGVQHGDHVCCRSDSVKECSSPSASGRGNMRDPSDARWADIWLAFSEPEKERADPDCAIDRPFPEGWSPLRRYLPAARAISSLRGEGSRGRFVARTRPPRSLCQPRWCPCKRGKPLAHSRSTARLPAGYVCSSSLNAPQ